MLTVKHLAIYTDTKKQAFLAGKTARIGNDDFLPHAMVRKFQCGGASKSAINNDNDNYSHRYLQPMF